MAEWCGEHNIEVWAYCLMPNHVHLIVVPQSADGLRRAIGEAHRRYTRRVNFRQRWRGHLWQGRFASFVLDEPYLLACARYVELNPVRARLATAPTEYRWSSACAHVKRKDDCPGEGCAAVGAGEELATTISSGRLEKKLGRVLRRQKPGPNKAGRRQLCMVSPELPPELPRRMKRSKRRPVDAAGMAG